MSFRNDLLQKGVTETQAAYVTQGFLDLLRGQITIASEDANLAICLFKSGQTTELQAALRELGQKLAEAVFSYKTTTLLLGKEEDDSQIGPL